MASLQGFIDYLNSIDKHSIYVWSGQGEYLKNIDEKWIRKKDTKGESYANRSIKMWNKNKGYENAQCFDCSGLGMYYFDNLTHEISDTNANGLKGKCTQITKGELRKGDFVFKVYTSGSKKGQAYHIGYVVDENGTIFSAKGRDENVPYVNESGWNWFGRPKFWSDAPKPTTKGYPITRNLKKGCKGEDVLALQKSLIASGFYPKGGADGSFGNGTKTALISYQKSMSISADGVAGKYTIGKLSATGIVYWAK